MATRMHGSMNGRYGHQRSLRGWASRALLTLGAVLPITIAAPQPAVAAEFRPGGLDLSEARERLGDSDGPVAGCLPTKDDPIDRAPAIGVGELARILGVLRQSPTAAALLDIAQARRVHVCLDGATHLLAYYFAGARVIGLNTGLTDAGKVLFLAHELGHVPQHPRYSDNRYFAPADLILLRRMREATAEALATRIAWELRTAGHPEIWREKTRTHYADVARAFQDAVLAEASGDALTGPQRLERATRAAFDRWFAADWRRHVYDRMTVAHVERIAGDAIGLVPTRRFLSHDFLLGIGRLGTRNFLDHTDGPRLDDPLYGGAMTADVERRLREVLEQARVSAAPGGGDTKPGVGS